VARRAEALAWQAEAGPRRAIPHDLADRDGAGRIWRRSGDGALRRARHPRPRRRVNTREAADDVTPEGWDVHDHLNLAVPFFLSPAHSCPR
jgi:hypothetical protein